MQEQIKQAMTLGLAAAGAEPAASPNPGKQPGGRILAAMFKANAGSCDCEPCRLLKQEVSTLFESFLAAGETPAATAEETPAVMAVSGPVEASAGA